MSGFNVVRKGSAKNALKDLKEHFTTTVNTLQDKFKDLAGALINDLNNTKQQFGQATAILFQNTQNLSNSIGHLDVNLLSYVKMLREVFGHQAQINEVFERLRSGASIQEALIFSEPDLERLKESAELWFTQTVGTSFAAVQAEMEAQKKEQDEKDAAQKAAMELLEAQKTDDTERNTVETELRKADSGLVPASPPAGPPSYPEGAEIFGG